MQTHLKALLHNNNFYHKLLNHIRVFFIDFLYLKGYSWPIYNINKSLTSNEQKKILFCYILEPFFSRPQDSIYHANYLHMIEMVKTLIDLRFAIDIYNYYDDKSEIMTDYDYILGFGKSYEKACRLNPEAIKILFLTENHPDIVNRNMKERLSYYKQRHGSIPKNISFRNTIYNDSMLKCSNIGIIINSDYNIKAANFPFKLYFKIDINAITNKNYIFRIKNYKEYKNSFVWFGSIGAIHKGLDLLIDVFSELPSLILNIYGLKNEEIFFSTEKYKNIRVHQRVNVTSNIFLNEVVEKNCFAILPSCSEAMSSGIATCMYHGLIPIITKEVGYESQPFIFELDSFNILNIKKQILEISNFPDKQINELSYSNHIYAKEKFTINAFSRRFHEILTNIMSPK